METGRKRPSSALNRVTKDSDNISSPKPSSHSRLKATPLPSSLKKPRGAHEKKRRKRRVQGQGICFSPHLVEVHEFHQSSPSKRRMDYRKRHVDEIDEAQIKLELELEGYKLTSVSSMHRRLLEKKQHEELLNELGALGFAPRTEVPLASQEAGASSNNNQTTGSHRSTSGSPGRQSPTPVAQASPTISIPQHRNQNGPRSPTRQTRLRDGSLPSQRASPVLREGEVISRSDKVDSRQLKHLRSRLELAKMLQQRANVRLAFDEVNRPINMSREKLLRKLLKRKVRTFVDNPRARRKDMVNALEIALLKEQDGLIGNGYDFGKRFVCVEEILDAEDVSNKQLRVWLENHGVKSIMKSKAGKITQCMRIVENVLKSQLDETVGLEMLDEVHRRRLNMSRSGISLDTLDSPITLPEGYDLNSRDGAWISVAKFNEEAHNAIVERNSKLFELIFQSGTIDRDYSDVESLDGACISSDEEEVDADPSLVSSQHQSEDEDGEFDLKATIRNESTNDTEQDRNEESDGNRDGSCGVM